MTAFVPLVEYPDFRGASAEARSIAIDYGEAVGIARSAKGWVVLVSPSTYEDIERAAAAAIAGDDPEAASADCTFDDDDDASWATKEDDDLIAEIHDDQDSYARSDEDGWFYGD